MARTERGLGTVLFSEIAGYDILARKDRSLAQLMLEEFREILRAKATEYGGREIGSSSNDSGKFGLRDWVAGPKTKERSLMLQSEESLVEFNDPLDAVLCALEIQRALHEHNKKLPRQREVRVQIGIDLGKMEIEEKNTRGSAVYFASRIAPLAEPGGVCVTQQVYEQIRGRTELSVMKLDHSELEGVELSSEIYRVAPSLVKDKESRANQSERRRVAILPFANISPDPSDEYFADGLTEELISTMSRVGELSVISRTSVMQYKGISKPIKEIGRELEAGTILEGSVRKSANRVRVTVQMIDAAEDRNVWAENYDREIQDIFAVQSDIAQRVTGALKVKLMPAEVRGLGSKPTESTEAYQLYLRGRHYWNERTRDDMNKAVMYFEEAVKLDPNYALAYAGLADYYIISTDYGWLRPKDGYPRAKEYAMKALEIDPGLAEPHVSLGVFYTHYEWEFREAEEEYKEAIKLKPSYATAYHWYGVHFLRPMGRLHEAQEKIKRARELDPLSKIIRLAFGTTLLDLGKVKEAIPLLDEVVTANPNYSGAHDLLGFAYYMDSKTDEALRQMQTAVELSGNDPAFKADLACLLGLIGRRNDANKIIGELEELQKTSYIDQCNIALPLFYAGRIEEAFKCLERGYEDRSVIIMEIKADPWFSEFRKDARWISLGRRVGFPEVSPSR